MAFFLDKNSVGKFGPLCKITHYFIPKQQVWSAYQINDDSVGRRLLFSLIDDGIKSGRFKYLKRTKRNDNRVSGSHQRGYIWGNPDAEKHTIIKRFHTGFFN